MQEISFDVHSILTHFHFVVLLRFSPILTLRNDVYVSSNNDLVNIFANFEVFFSSFLIDISRCGVRVQFTYQLMKNFFDICLDLDIQVESCHLIVRHFKFSSFVSHVKNIFGSKIYRSNVVTALGFFQNIIHFFYLFLKISHKSTIFR